MHVNNPSYSCSTTTRKNKEYHCTKEFKQLCAGGKFDQPYSWLGIAYLDVVDTLINLHGTMLYSLVIDNIKLFNMNGWLTQMVGIDGGREIVLGGGNIHCITQQQPAVLPRTVKHEPVYV